MTSKWALWLAVCCAGCTIQIAGSDTTLTITGKVAYQGAPVVGATVSALDSAVTTNNQGEYRLEVKPDDDRVQLSVEAKGFGPTIAVVTRRSSVFHYHANLELTVPTKLTMPMGDAGMQQMSLTAGGQTIGIEIPPDALPPGSTLEVTAYSAQNGPGTMETTEGADRLLQTGGMLHIKVVDQSGKAVKTLGGSGLSIKPATMMDIGTTGDTQAYSLNSNAVWNSNTMTIGATDKALKAQQDGFWNCDRNYRTACLKGKISAPSKACGGQKVTAGGSDAFGLFSQDTSGSAGEFCVEGPSRLGRTLTIGNTSKPISFPSTPGSCRTSPADCTDLGSVTVTDTDCPSSCAKDEIDTPTGCEKKPSGAGGGGGAGGGSGGSGGSGGPGFSCGSTQQCGAWSTGTACKWRACACLETGASCVRGWYETNGGKVYACAACTSSCTSAAMALIANCK